MNKEQSQRFDYIMEDYYSSRAFTAPEDTGKKVLCLEKAWYALLELIEPILKEENQDAKD